MSEPPRTPDCNCLALRQAARDLSRRYEAHLGPAGITITQFSILGFLRHQPAMGMAALADAMVMDRTSLLRALKPLQRDGLVVSTAAGRRLELSLTAEGAAKLRAAAPLWRRAQAEFEAQFGASRAARLRDDLREITQQGDNP